jgi:hypothetical protein
MSIEAQRAARRAAMPLTTAFVEQYAEFAPTLIYAVEGERSYGKPPKGENAFTIPPGYRMATHVEKVKR